jgi:intracellular multiplication protein IcmK
MLLISKIKHIYNINIMIGGVAMSILKNKVYSNFLASFIVCFCSCMHINQAYAQNNRTGSPPPSPFAGLPPPPPPSSQSINRKVDSAVSDFKQSQLKRNQIREIKEINLTTQEAAMTPYNTIAKPVTRTLMIDLSPGATSPVLRLSSGQLSSLVFSDLNGDPWYIDKVALNRNMFSDGSNGGAAAEQTNVLTVEPMRAAAYGNITVSLRGLSTPVIFSLVTGQKEVDFRVDIKVPGRNPDSVSRVNYADKMPTLDENIPYFLDGVPPREAKKLRVQGSGSSIAQAWEYAGNMYIRTNADVQYPAYYSSARSTSGTAVYRFDKVYNSITLLHQGRAQTIGIEQY